MTTIYRNAAVFTGSADEALQEAFSVEGGRFQAVGSEAEVREAAGPDAAEVDLGGGFVSPGVIEAHAHLAMFGESLGKVQLRDCKSLGEIQQRLIEAREANPEAPRILGVSWLFEAVGDVHPTAAMIDEVLPDVPVYLDANDLHSAWVNSAALAELGITRETPDPVGGEIARDEHGEATGLLYETAAMSYVWDFLDSTVTDEKRVEFLDSAFAAYLAAGVTGATDMSLNAADVAAIRRILARDGRLPFAITGHWLLQPSGDTAEDLAAVERVVGLRDEVAAAPGAEWFRIVGVKFIMDGVIDACTATMRAPYANGSNCDPIWNEERVFPVAAAADAAGLQIAMHAIGDRTSEIALDAIEHCIAVNGERERRHRIEHLESVADTTIERMARLGVTASMQPVHCDPAVLDNWKSVLGDERAETGFPWQKFRSAGVRLALGTDAPTAPYEALPNLYIALTGGSAIDPSLPPYHPERVFRPAEALSALTAGAAYAGETDGVNGRIAAGLRADFALLDVNPLEAEADRLLTARVQQTFVAGESAYEAR
ncbi:amidohydrolase [Leucobacter sp. CSA1]|uniref:Amidohydrolase n=1 Tax=Leucobacter chromiisoli TaxID=2796471 RepID=A0A934UUK1_9MICO|nr:amidohydrolase [Leucobacter chromiisoli]MBK0419584.1 amidohydrolase [Leucobacter chromiisoli]